MESDHTSMLVINTSSTNIITLNAQVKNSIDTPPALEEQIVEQALDNNGMTASLHAGHAQSKLNIDQRGLHVQKSIVDKSLQIVAQASLRARIQFLARHPLIVGHPRRRWRYDTLRRTYYRPQVSSNVYTAIAKSKSGMENKSRYCHKRP